MQVDNNNQNNQKSTAFNGSNDINVVQVGEIVCITLAIYFSINGKLTSFLYFPQKSFFLFY